MLAFILSLFVTANPSPRTVQKYDVHTQRGNLGVSPSWHQAGCIPGLDMDGSCYRYGRQNYPATVRDNVTVR